MTRAARNLKSLVPGLVLGVLCACLVLGLSVSGALAPLDRYIQETLFRRRGERLAGANIVLVMLDSATIARFRTTPLPRSVYADVVEKVAAGGARTIAVNFLFDVRGDAPGDRKLVEVAQKSGNVLLGYTFDVPSATPGIDLPSHEALRASPRSRAKIAFSIAAPFPELAGAAAGYGHLNLSPEEDGSWRSVPNLMRYRGNMYPSLALASAIHALGTTPNATISERGEVLIAGETPRRVPVNQSGETPINWLGGTNVFPTYNFLRVLDGEVPVGTFRDAIVVIGTTKQGNFTPVVTPFGTTQSDSYLLANAIDDIVSGRLLRNASWLVWGLYLFLPALCVGAVVASRGTIQAVGFLLVWTVFLWVTALTTFREQNVYISLAAPQLALLLTASATIAYRQIFDARDARRVTQLFGAYVGEEVLRELAGRPPELHGEIRSVAVLFCDIRGFSTLAEQLQDDPARLLHLLNDHFDPLTEILKSRGAFVDKFVGDLVMAVFGAPLASPSDAANARNAVLSAIEVLANVERRNRERRALGEPLIEVGIGVHCGPAIVGNLGSRRQMNYTAIGDTVNIGSRVEDATRVYDVPLLVTEEVMDACKLDPETQSLRWKFVDETIVRNRRQPVRLYTVRRESILERQTQILEQKNAAKVSRR